MPYKKDKPTWRDERPVRTGEDIDMLREQKQRNEKKGDLKSESPDYKDHIDGA
ncbi:MAG: hypothetical protein MJ241_02240 [Bacilli bacterium]|nr:hypothetical protein [Bacilli bacterium]